jgi:stearoyl-CoA desaturase (Delta-9 desaturase)
MKKLTRFAMWQIKTIQYGALVSALFFAPVVDWSALAVALSLIAYYVYSAVGVSMMYHRYWSHRAFEFKWKWLRWPLTLLGAFAGRGSPLAWVHIHRTHHRNADKEGDPHRPGDTLKVFSFGTTNINQFSPARVADLLGQKMHRWLHDYYLLFMLNWVSVLGIVGGLEAVYFGWVLPVVMYQLAQDLWNYYGHKRSPNWSYQNWGCSYRNGVLLDDPLSQNNILLYPLVLGEAWHNNHHQWPNSYRMSYRDYEPDPIAWLIERIKNDDAPVQR